MTETPPGFRPLSKVDEVLGGFDPVYFREEPEGQVALGFRVGRQHCNPRGHCHGGTWATMADVIMGMNMGFVTGRSGPTVSMSIDFMGPAAEGQWVEGYARVLRWTRNLGFAECHFMADGELALRANAIFRRKIAPYATIQALLAGIATRS